MRVVSFEASFKKALFGRLADGLDKAAVRLRAEIQYEIGTQGPPRSSPGEAPHRDTGDLQASFFDETDPDDLVARVGSDSPYVLALELGSGRTAARPFFLGTLIREADDLGRIICR